VPPEDPAPHGHMSDSSLAPGTRIGPYEIVSLLGQGGMGAVYKAKDLRLSREIALKVLRGDVASDADRLRRFAAEARAASLLNHPNIVAVYDIGEQDGSPYIISELLQGETLRDRLSTGPLPARKAIEFALQILRGLAAAHDKGIVHRDLKPENLFLTKDGLVKILDFGIAKLSRQGQEPAGTDVETESHTGTGAILGTVGYMSPEQVRGLPVDSRSDLFSFGTVLYEMLAGKRAFKGTTPADTMSAILREDPTEALGSGPVLAAGVIRVVRRSLEKAPEDRFQSARDLAFALEGATPSDSRSTGTEPRPAVRVSPLLPRRTLVAVAALAAAAGLAWWLARLTAPTSAPTTYQRLTFRAGKVQSATFGRDGETILYSARWGNRPTELFEARANTRGERPLGLTDGLILAISRREEMALLLRPQISSWQSFEGTLARAPMAGGAPREVLEGVLSADWSPDGQDLAVVHVVRDRYRLEYPIGHVLVAPDPPAWISALRVSPSGDQVAFLEHPVARDNRGDVSLVDRAGQKRTLASGFAALNGLGWSPERDEIWFGASRVNGSPDQIRAVSLSGRQRLIEEAPGGFYPLDISPRGQILGARTTLWTEVRARARGAEETELAAADLSFLQDISDDGKLVLGTDTGQGGGPNSSFYVQKTDGTRPLWLGEGDGQALSPDGRFVLALVVHTQPQQLLIVPTAAGETRTLDPGAVVQYSRAVWDGTGRVVFSGADKKNSERLYVQDVAGGPPRAVTDDGVLLSPIGRPVSPDGQRVVAVGAEDGVPAVYPLAGGKPVAIPGLDTGDVTLCWTPDGREILVAHYEENESTPPRIQRIEVATGRAQPWTRLGRTLASGLIGTYRVLVTPDGESYAYNYTRSLSDLYLTSRLR
jgi:eukaryotic-like serine/threonine-protein kinase